jgi:hypothetical protein
MRPYLLYKSNRQKNFKGRSGLAPAWLTADAFPCFLYKFKVQNIAASLFGRRWGRGVYTAGGGEGERDIVPGCQCGG